jgi:hypothetical protein
VSSAGYTQVAHIYQDFVAPTLEPAEQICMNYIMRRTIGFTDGKGGRKVRDTIAIDQFVNGIRVGDVVMDLGTGLGRNTVRKALVGLESRGLVEVRWACTECYWEQQRDEPAPPIRAADERKRNPVPPCPRCKRTLSRSWAVAPLTPRKVRALMNAWSAAKDERRDARNKEHVVYGWDTDRRRFTWSADGDDEAAQRELEALSEEIARLEGLLWYPQYVNEAIRQAESSMRSGARISPKRILRDFYKPVYDMQQEFSTAPLIEYALKETIRRRVPAERRGRNWVAYPKAICKSHRARFEGRTQPKPGTNAAEQHAQSLPVKKKAATDLLSRAAALNDRGQTDQARELLSEILSDSLIRGVAPLFGGDLDRAEYQLRLAFKHGTSDFVGAELDPYGIDHYPGWPQPT